MLHPLSIAALLSEEVDALAGAQHLEREVSGHKGRQAVVQDAVAGPPHVVGAVAKLCGAIGNRSLLSTSTRCCVDSSDERARRVKRVGSSVVCRACRPCRQRALLAVNAAMTSTSIRAPVLQTKNSACGSSSVPSNTQARIMSKSGAHTRANSLPMYRRLSGEPCCVCA